MAFLPVAGLLIGLLYHHLGKEVEGGNNLLLSEVQSPQKTIPLKMAPLVLISTLITHLFGGSAGREGTAVQMGGSLADQLSKPLKLSIEDRRIILICGISAGFASVFGTPFAAIVFSLELISIGKLSVRAVVPSVLSAFTADLICDSWGIYHTSYRLGLAPALSAINVIYCCGAAIFFGLAARYYIALVDVISRFAKRLIAYAPLRPALGGIIVAGAVFALDTTKYIGLGIPTIISAFKTQLPPYDFLLKMVFTAVTLGFGFKGGEVTPLFFIGATLGSALSIIIPLPFSLLAAIGFVAVFSGAAKTPIASTLMAMELFGIEYGMFATIACGVAYYFSGPTGIYEAYDQTSMNKTK
jgi:H+/Cl- antiporter ClcA